MIVTIDRIVDGTAVLVPKSRPDARFAMRQEILPGGIRDGSRLIFHIERDDPGGDMDRREIAELQQELSENSGGPPRNPSGG